MITITRTRFNRHGNPVTRNDVTTDENHADLLAELYASAGWLVSITFN